MNKKTALNVSEEIKAILETWLKQSNLTIEQFLKFRTVKGFKIYKERDEEGKMVLYLTCRDGNDRFLMGANLVAASDDDEVFLLDAKILIRHMAKLLDDENRINPINGSYANDYFMTRSTTYFDIKENA